MKAFKFIRKVLFPSPPRPICSKMSPFSILYFILVIGVLSKDGYALHSFEKIVAMIDASGGAVASLYSK